MPADLEELGQLAFEAWCASENSSGPWPAVARVVRAAVLREEAARLRGKVGVLRNAGGHEASLAASALLGEAIDLERRAEGGGS